MVLLQLHAHLNSVFAHFVEFHLRFHTLEDKELEVIFEAYFTVVFQLVYFVEFHLGFDIFRFDFVGLFCLS